MSVPVWVIDRIEGERAVMVRSGSEASFECPVRWLPDAIGEGATLRLAPVPRTRGARSASGQVSITLPDGEVVKVAPEAAPPGLRAGASIRFIEAPGIEAEKRRTVAERIQQLATTIEDDFEL